MAHPDASQRRRCSTPCLKLPLIVLGLGMVAFLNFSSFLVSQVFATSRHGSAGALSLISMYTSMTICTFFAPFAVAKLGALKAVALLGLPGYTLFTAAVGFGTGWQVVLAGIATGASASVLWVGMASAIAEASTEARRGQNNAVFTFMLRASFGMNGAVGALIKSGVSAGPIYGGLLGLSALAHLGMLAIWLQGGSVAASSCCCHRRRERVATTATSTLTAASEPAVPRDPEHHAAGDPGRESQPGSSSPGVCAQVTTSVVYTLAAFKQRPVAHFGLCIGILAWNRAFAYSTFALQLKDLMGEAAIGHAMGILGLALLASNLLTGPCYDWLYKIGMRGGERTKGRLVLLGSFVLGLAGVALSLAQRFSGVGWWGYVCAGLIGASMGSSETAVFALFGHIASTPRDVAAAIAVRTVTDGVGFVAYMVAQGLLTAGQIHVLFLVAFVGALVLVITWPPTPAAADCAVVPACKVGGGAASGPGLLPVDTDLEASQSAHLSVDSDSTAGSQPAISAVLAESPRSPLTDSELGADLEVGAGGARGQDPAPRADSEPGPLVP